MKVIESIIKRKNGTTVWVGVAKYHFKPNESGAHVEDVSDDHAEIFLRIPEGYRLYQAAGSTKPAASDAPNDAQVLQGNGGSGEAGASDEAQTPAEPNQKPKRPYAPRKSAK